MTDRLAQTTTFGCDAGDLVSITASGRRRRSDAAQIVVHERDQAVEGAWWLVALLLRHP